MIRHVHVNECDSTQDLLKEQLNQNTSETVLVSCENQISGRGRGENKWKSMPGTVCLSLNIQPHIVMSFTALELSVIVAKFFESKGKTLQLKWPNDLWDTHGKKCGGILVQGSQNQLYAGIGINLFTDDADFGGVFEGPFVVEKEVWSRELADYILAHRYESTELLRKDWLSRCGHLNQMVRVTEAGEIYEGIFQGIGEHGEALVCSDSQINHIYNGTLRPIS